MIRIAPSILSADFLRLGDEVRAAEAAGVDRVQIDVMDGRFVPNITFGADVVRSLRPLTRIQLETHLMVEPPEEFIDPMAEAGADTVIIHQEATPNLHSAVERIHALGKKAGVAINPATPACMLSEILPDIELALVMTVNPGFGGQKFIPRTVPKIGQVWRMIRDRQLACELEVDGGINLQTIIQVVEAGANVIVAGSSVYGRAEGVGAAVQALLRACAGREREA